MSSYTVEQTTVNQLSQTLQNKQNVGDYATNDNVDNKLKTNVINYTTNRILEIPQDIKAELNNGVITIKAGTKVYIPNGFETDGITRKFDIIILTKDLTYTEPTSTALTLPLFVSSNGNGLFRRGNNNSGKTVPDNYTGAFYNLTTNKMESYNGGSLSVTMSLPICVCTNSATTGNNMVSIDQIFNGFGYIGSTLFLLPGVKTVVPDGRNEDGTCKNKAPSTVTSVKTETISRAVTAYMFTNFVSSVIAIHHYVCSKTKPIVTETTLWYNPETNLPSQVLSDGTVITPYEEIPIAKFTSDSTGKITSFEPFAVDSVVNSNASNFSQAGRSYLSGLGMPSGRYIDLTLGASGSTYTAPANGWLFLMKRTADNSQNIRFICNGREDIAWGSGISNTDVISLFPVCSGDVVTIKYSAQGRVSFFRFIYANGEQ